MPESRAADLGPVLAGDWCIGCGACTAADPSVRVELDETLGAYRPSHSSTSAAAAVCPAIEVDIGELSRTLFPDAPETSHGAVERVWLAQSTNVDENAASSSGGLVRPILRHLLRTGAVSGVVALAEVDGLRYEQRLHTTTGDVDTLPGSVYHVVEHSRMYEILEQAQGPLAIVAIPCQLEGLYLYLSSEQGRHLRDKVGPTIGLFCGWQYTMHGVRALGTYRRFDPDAIDRITYRGGGPVGKMRIHLEDGTQRTLNRRVAYSTQVAFDRSFNPPRCQVCVNHSNFLADLALGDAWLAETVTSRTGVSVVVARTKSSVTLIEDLAASGTLRIEAADLEVVERSQGRNVAYGDMAYSLAAMLRRRGEPVPKIDAPNRPAHRPVDDDAVERNWREIQRKRSLQREGRYWYLFVRKSTVELPLVLRRLMRSRLIGRYLRRGLTRQDSRDDGRRLDGFT